MVIHNAYIDRHTVVHLYDDLNDLIEVAKQKGMGHTDALIWARERERGVRVRRGPHNSDGIAWSVYRGRTAAS
jgi:hypothetical protein